MKVKLIEVHPDNCTGCERCGMVCSFHLEQESSITKSRIKVLHDTDRFAWDWPLLCIQCAEAPCIESCSVGSLYRDESSGVVVVDDTCMGCGECITACPLHALALDEEKAIIFKCDLCGGDPECARACEPKAVDYVNAHQLQYPRLREAAGRLCGMGQKRAA